MEASVSDRSGSGKDDLPYRPDVSRHSAWQGEGMDKKEINSPKMTLNFLIWVDGVFMLLLFVFLAHFVWRIF
jgi:hypothetical protein